MSELVNAGLASERALKGDNGLLAKMERAGVVLRGNSKSNGRRGRPAATFTAIPDADLDEAARYLGVAGKGVAQRLTYIQERINRQVELALSRGEDVVIANGQYVNQRRMEVIGPVDVKAQAQQERRRIALLQRMQDRRQRAERGEHVTVYGGWSDQRPELIEAAA
jgi:hypothetical protein